MARQVFAHSGKLHLLVEHVGDPTPHVGNSDPNFPNADLYFAADYTSDLNVASAGTYTFTEISDDAGYLFVDSSLVTSTPGNHLPSTGSNSIYLTAGLHTFEYEMTNGGGPCCAEADVALPTGVTYSSGMAGAVPEPTSWALMIVGMGLVGAGLRSRRPQVTMLYRRA